MRHYFTFIFILCYFDAVKLLIVHNCQPIGFSNTYIFMQKYFFYITELLLDRTLLKNLLMLKKLGDRQLLINYIIS